MLRPRDFFVMLLLFAAVLGALLIPRRPRTPTDSLSPTAGIENADPDSDITGVVIDTRGRPVAGARITTDYRIWGRARIPGPDWLRAEVEGPVTLSARDGTFRLDVGHGEIVDLCIRPQVLGEAKACWRRPGDHLRIVVTDGADLDALVTDEAGAPLADVRVFVLGVLPFRAPMHYHSGVTNRHGHYRYAALSAGQIQIHAAADGRKMIEPCRAEVPAHGTVSVSVRLQNGPPPTPPPRRDWPVEGLVRDDTGAAVEGARVVFNDIRARTDETGRYRLLVGAGGPAPLSIWKPGSGRLLTSRVALEGTNAHTLPVGRTVTGRSPQKLIGAVVELGRGPTAEEIAIVDSRGTFRFADVAPGRWQLTLLHRDSEAISRTVVVPEDRDPEIVDFRVR